VIIFVIVVGLLLQSKDDQSAFEMLYQLMTLFNYREIYFENLTNLQVNNVCKEFVVIS